MKISKPSKKRRTDGIESLLDLSPSLFFRDHDFYHMHARPIPFASIIRLWWMIQGLLVHSAILEPVRTPNNPGGIGYLPSFWWWRSYPLERESERERRNGEVMQTNVTLTLVNIMETSWFWRSAGLMDVSPGLLQECTQALPPAIWCHLSSVPRERW